VDVVSLNSVENKSIKIAAVYFRMFTVTYVVHTMETWYSMSLPATFRVEMTGLEILHQNLSGKYTFGLMNPV